MSVWNDILNFLLPQRCIMCGERLQTGEKHLCMNCFLHLPFTDYHLVEHSLLEKQFWGLFPIEKAVSLFHHDGEKTRHIIYSIKYWERPEVGRCLAARYATDLQKSRFFDDMDVLVPLPLHWRRQLKRHYNQSHYICQGIHDVTGLPVFKNVVRRVKNNVSQTHLNARQRTDNVKGIFRLTHPEKIAGKHILLVDDVTTTGATLASCAQELAKAPNVRISVLTLAVAARTAIPALERESIDTSIFGVPLME